MGAVVASVLIAALIAPASASASCSFNATTRVVTIAAHNFDVLSRDVAGNILYNSTICQDAAMTNTAMLTNTNTITITQDEPGDQNFTINHSIGPFTPGFTSEGGSDHSEVEIEIDLGAHNGGDSVDLVGTPNNDTYRLGVEGINLNVDPVVDDVDVTGPIGGPLTANVEHFRVIPGGSADTVTGSPANQSGPLPGTLTVFDGDGQNDSLTGGPNLGDLLDYGGATSPLTIDLNLTAPQNTGAGVDTLAGFESVFGANQADTLIGTPANNTILGADGLDRIVGGPGDDRLFGGPPIGDTLDYSGAPMGVQVTLDNDQPQDTVGAGTDEVDDFENLIGTPFDDFLEGDDEVNVITAGGGVDLVFARPGNDQLLIRDGIGDTAFCGDGSDSVTADVQGLDSFPIADCELIDFAALPPLPPMGTAPPVSGPTPKVKKKCKKKRKKKGRGAEAAKKKKKKKKKKKCKRKRK